MSPLITASLLAGMLNFEYKSSMRLMVSSPLCGGALTGLALGSPAEGLLAGLMLQTLVLGAVKLRGRPEPALAPAGVLCAAVYIEASGRAVGIASIEGLILFLSVLAGAATAAAGGFLYRRWERAAAGPAGHGLALAARGRLAAAGAVHLGLTSAHLAIGGLIVLILYAPAVFTVEMLSQRLETLAAGSMAAAALMIPFAGAGSLLRLFLYRTHLFWFAAGFLVTCVILLSGGV